MFRNVRQLLLLLPMLLSAGCGNFAGRIVAQPDPTIELLESELRWMEENLYHLDDQLDRCLDQLESARRNNAVLRTELAELRRASNATERATTDAMEGPFDEERDFDPEQLLKMDPVVELGAPSQRPDQGEPPPTIPPEDEIDLQGIPDPELIPGQGEGPAAQPNESPENPFDAEDLDDANEVKRILLNRRLTGGYDLDGKSGHDGVIVVIEPQDAFAQYVRVPGHVTVEVRDPQQSGLPGRVGKWKFDAIETLGLMKKTLMGRGVHLQLPWPGDPPLNDELQLSVRYELVDGRTLKSQMMLRLKPSLATLAAEAEEAERSLSVSTRPTRTAARSDWQPNR